MNDQCNICGSYESLLPCAHCKTVLCERCRRNYERVCEEMQKRKARGEGPTVRNLGMTRNATMPAVLGAPYDLSKPSLDPAELFGHGVEVSTILNPLGLGSSVENPLVVRHVADVDQGLASVKDLLKAAKNETGK